MHLRVEPSTPNPGSSAELKVQISDPTLNELLITHRRMDSRISSAVFCSPRLVNSSLIGKLPPADGPSISFIIVCHVIILLWTSPEHRPPSTRQESDSHIPSSILQAGCNTTAGSHLTFAGPWRSFMLLPSFGVSLSRMPSMLGGTYAFTSPQVDFPSNYRDV